MDVTCSTARIKINIEATVDELRNVAGFLEFSLENEEGDKDACSGCGACLQCNIEKLIIAFDKMVMENHEQRPVKKRKKRNG